MIITVVGLGLIGGSFAKAVKSKTSCVCYGIDVNAESLRQAVAEEAIDGEAPSLSVGDITLLCLYPDEIVRFVEQNAGAFRPGSVVLDVCGVKGAIVTRCTSLLAAHGVYFLGTHPMAGREFSGFSYAQENLFEKASWIFTPVADTAPQAVQAAERLAKALSFRKVVYAATEEHDAIIAYTSQLAHIVSNAYVKSPTAQRQCGFSAGSFRDLTRVARLNEEMWTSLFLLNRQALLREIEILQENLEEYQKALEEEDASRLKELLRNGRVIKEKLDNTI